jgi:hypothetical protein
VEGAGIARAYPLPLTLHPHHCYPLPLIPQPTYPPPLSLTPHPGLGVRMGLGI